MDNQKNNIDELFRKKLENHSERPSKLAWEKLESQLGPQAKKGSPLWLRIAASLLIIGLAGYIGWSIAPDQTVETPHPIADNSPALPSDEQEGSVQNLPSTVEQAEEPSPKQEVPATQKVPESFPLKDDKAKKQHDGDKVNKQVQPKPSKVQKEIPIEIPSASTGNLALEIEEYPAKASFNPEELIAAADIAPPIESEPVSYKVSIKSSGISEKPKKEKLVTEIGDKINTIGGLISKVDDGYAQLQDAKNNLFAELVSKKETN